MILKLTSITSTLHKRNLYYNKPMEINYADGIINNVITIKPNETHYMVDINSIPSDVRKFKMLGLLLVDDISLEQFNNETNGVEKPQSDVTKKKTEKKKEIIKEEEEVKE